MINNAQQILEFYFDPISPYPWLAWRPLLKLRDQYGFHLKSIPVLFAGLLNAHDNHGPAEIPAKMKHVFLDVLRYAKLNQLNPKFPPAHPFNPLKALRMCTAIENQTDQEKFIGKLLDTVWNEGQDVTDENILQELANSIQLDGNDLLEKIQAPVIKQKLKTNTEQAIEKGVFGVPTFVIDNQLFWGHDRLTLVEAYLQGNLAIDANKMKEVLARPRAADRKNP